MNVDKCTQDTLESQESLFPVALATFLCNHIDKVDMSQLVQ